MSKTKLNMKEIDMSKTKLREYPFCGSDKVSINDFDSEFWDVDCEKCGATGPRKDTERKAVNAWNKRQKEIEPEVIRYTRDVDPSHG